jgi:hypothetical protein
MMVDRAADATWWSRGTRKTPEMLVSRQLIRFEYVD